MNRLSRGAQDLEVLARLLLRAESVASSHIEGLSVGPRRLLRAEAARQMGAATQDVTAEEVLGNIEAMRWAIELARTDKQLDTEDICEIHRRLVTGTRLEPHGGQIARSRTGLGVASTTLVCRVHPPTSGRSRASPSGSLPVL